MKKILKIGKIKPEIELILQPDISAHSLPVPPWIRLNYLALNTLSDQAKNSFIPNPIPLSIIG